MGLLIVPILAFLIIIHELGHFFAARSVGVVVEEFGIGIPPRVKGWKRNGVLWSLNAIPFGGFVRVKGEDGTDVSAGSMNSVGPLKRGWFLVAGPLMNLLAAVVLSILIVGIQGKPVELAPLYIGTVAPASPAEEAGWRPGDKIVAVNGVKLDETQDVINAINANAGEETDVVVERGTKLIETSLVPRTDPPPGEGATGIGVDNGRLSKVTIDEVQAGSIAEEAGLLPGDEIVSINGIEIEAFAQAVGILNGSQGSEATITVIRDDSQRDITFQVPETSILVQNVSNDSPAAEASLYPGDRITEVDGTPVTSGSSFVKAIRDAAGESAELRYEREGELRTTVIEVPPVPESTTNYHPVVSTGLAAAPVPAFQEAGISIVGTVIYEDVPPSQVVQEGWGQFWAIITGTVEMIRSMFTQGIDRDQLTGPIGMGQLTSELLAETPEPAWVILTQLTILISVSLGVLNLLPLPALDGGRLLFVLIEIARGGKRIAPEKEGLVHLAGMVLLLGLMFFIAFGDVTRIMDGESILP
ncbi:MAG TPA: RIP metalloprotease RseP [Thermomicrobiales bacterium]|nr:RIP metalloprotease RseP [Thermomicrobiales bacterium]